MGDVTKAKEMGASGELKATMRKSGSTGPFIDYTEAVLSNAKTENDFAFP